MKLVLLHDRNNCSPDFLEDVKGDLMKVLSSYAEFDQGDMDVRITSTDEEGRTALIANIPIKHMKR